MEISSNMQAVQQSSNAVQTNFTEKISKDNVAELKNQISQNANEMMFKSVSVQSNVSFSSDGSDFVKNYNDFQSFLNDAGYTGSPIAELTQEEATELVSEDGLFGITQTSDRIADFVIDGSSGDESRMRAGREGMLEGFKMAEEMWGGELPEISQKTMEAAIEKVDKAMYDLGFSIMDQEA